MGKFDVRSFMRQRATVSTLAVLFAVLLWLAVGAGIASAQEPVDGVEDVACLQTSPCTAGDIKITTMKVLNTPACLDDGTGNLYADILVQATVLSTASSRYDIGLWIALDGGNANSGPGNQCYHGILSPLENPPRRRRLPTTVHSVTWMETIAATFYKATGRSCAN